MVRRIKVIAIGALLLPGLSYAGNAGRNTKTSPITSEVSPIKQTTRTVADGKRAQNPILKTDDVTLQPIQPEPQVDPVQRIETNMATGAAYKIGWQSINAGGGASSSTNFETNSSAGQPTIGNASSTNYQAGIGYWYGTTGGGGGGCDCPFQADINGDGFVDSVDLSLVIDIVFFGAPDIQDPDCTTTRGDFNNDGFADSVDLSLVIDYVFFGGPPAVDPCLAA